MSLFRELTINLLVANFLYCICAKNYGNWLAVDKVIAKISTLTFLALPVHFAHVGRSGGHGFYRRKLFQMNALYPKVVQI